MPRKNCRAADTGDAVIHMSLLRSENEAGDAGDEIVPAYFIDPPPALDVEGEVWATCASVPKAKQDNHAKPRLPEGLQQQHTFTLEEHVELETSFEDQWIMMTWRNSTDGSLVAHTTDKTQNQLLVLCAIQNALCIPQQVVAAPLGPSSAAKALPTRYRAYGDEFSSAARQRSTQTTPKLALARQQRVGSDSAGPPSTAVANTRAVQQPTFLCPHQKHTHQHLGVEANKNRDWLPLRARSLNDQSVEVPSHGKTRKV
ncbi:hypothetical protein VDGL01_00147 [Verticillium dahliae]